MTTTVPAPHAATVLCGPARSDLVRAAIGLAAGAPVDVRVERVQHRGDGTSVGYDVRYGGAGDAGSTDYLVASTAPAALSAQASSGVVRLSDGDLDVALWRHPGDPALPGLAASCDVATVAAWLPGTTRLEMVTYRPLRRAVVRALGPAGVTGYVKIVRPGGVDRLVRQHAATAELGSPRVLAAPAPGVLVLADVGGRTLAEAIADGDRAPDLADVLALLERTAATATREVAVEPFSLGLLAQVAAVEGALDAPTTQRLRRLARAVEAWIARTARAWPVVATHGDLHAANLVVRTTDGDAEIVGVLDVDRVGPGHRVDDLACLLAHLSVASTGAGGLATAASDRARATVERWWSQVADPAPLAARTASVVLSLVGVVDPVRVPALLDLAGAWCARASTPNAPLHRGGTGSVPPSEES
ncbi:aminoglycoside phosphotransferase family protein [Serinibacter arcticus]|uniref:Aminoglycoside phosphotransferase domain-containing protein n=1 Tax=Serinibacter arcticus TaxID=1655435 RepID=A0A4Z1E505_9MICO|nr:aminoglycoside phosphotransferase family protein [Serinibacter arcticus]TGO06360.1 hypothetical protein SERN_0552 [Serinibacter arcticus]